MIIKRKPLFIYCIITLIMGCNSNVSEKELLLLKKEYYNNGVLALEGVYLNDSIKHGLFKGYYETGELKYETEYKNDFKDGESKYYYLNGNNESKARFKNGLQEGKTFWYYSDGKLREESYWINNKQFGHTYLFYDNGKIEKYKAIDFEQHTRYIRKYDDKGNIIKDEGSVLGQFLLEGDFDSIPIGKEFTAKISIAQPPNTKTSVVIGESPKNEKVANFTAYPHIDGIVTYKKKIIKAGEYKIVTIGKMEDFQNGLVKQDTIFTLIRVID